MDTSAVLCAAAEAGIKIHAAITVLTSDTATDEPFAQSIADAAGITHYPIRISLLDLLKRQLPVCIRALKTFDGMELRNAIVVCEALQKARDLGYGATTLMGLKFADAFPSSCGRFLSIASMT